MKKEIRIFFTAMMFLTRLPVPRSTDHAPEYLEKAAKYFPFIGWMVGGTSALVFFICYPFLSLDLAVLSSMVAGILATGAFHEDGFADVCDAFGGGWTKEKILDIMKDSRLGTFGVTGLIFMLSAKYLLLKELASLIFTSSSLRNSLSIFLLFLLAHGISRMMAIITIQTSVYVFADDRTKSKPLASKKLSITEFSFSFFLSLLPFLYFPAYFLLLLPIVLIVTLLASRYFKKWIGGYTGDCLGAIQQITEVVCYLTLVLLWKYT